MEFKVYYLSSSAAPEEVRYVGITTKSPRKRLIGHLKGDTGPYTHRWVLSEQSKGNEVLITKIESFKEPRFDREIYWIAHYRGLGAKLTNLTDGGEGALGRKWTEEQLKRDKGKSIFERATVDQRKEWMEKSSKTKRKNRKFNTYKKVYELNEKGEVINEFYNGMHCAEVIGISPNCLYVTLQDAKKCRARCRGRIFTQNPSTFHSLKEPNPSSHLRRDCHSVLCENVKTGESKHYGSVNEACEDLKVHRDTISKAVREERLAFGKYKFTYTNTLNVKTTRKVA